MRTISESDWKIFKRVRESALERFSERILAEIQAVCADDSQTAHKRYGQVYEYIHDRDKEMAEAFNDLRRSTAVIRLIQMQSLQLVAEHEIEQFSDEIQALLENYK